MYLVFAGMPGESYRQVAFVLSLVIRLTSIERYQFPLFVDCELSVTYVLGGKKDSQKERRRKRKKIAVLSIISSGVW